MNVEEAGLKFAGSLFFSSPDLHAPPRLIFLEGISGARKSLGHMLDFKFLVTLQS